MARSIITSERKTLARKKRDIWFNFLFNKAKFPNSMILPPNNGGLKAWSHRVRKDNLLNRYFYSVFKPSESENNGNLITIT